MDGGVGRRVDCSVSNEAKNEIKEESPSGLSLGCDGGNLGGEGGEWAHRWAAKKTKERQKIPTPIWARKLTRRSRKPYFQEVRRQQSDPDTEQPSERKRPRIIGDLLREKAEA